MFYQGDECFEGILKDGITPPDIQVKLFKFVVEAKLYTFNQPEARHKIPQLTKPFAYLRENVFHTQPNQSYFKARSDLYRLLLCPSVRQSIADTVCSLNVYRSISSQHKNSSTILHVRRTTYMYFCCSLRKEYKQEKMTARDLQSLIIKEIHMYKRKGQGIGYKCIYTYVVIMSSLGASVLRTNHCALRLAMTIWSGRLLQFDLIIMLKTEQEKMNSA